MEETKYLHVMDKEDVAQLLLETLCVLDAIGLVEQAERHLRDSEIPKVRGMTTALEQDRELLWERVYDAVTSTRTAMLDAWSFGYPLLDVLQELDATFHFGQSYEEGKVSTFKRVRHVNEVFEQAHNLLQSLDEVETP